MKSQFLFLFFALISLANLSSRHTSSSCEICSNGIDDDNNGLVDCADPACNCDEDAAITICYISDSRCSGDCGYTFDGARMKESSRKKLENANNFGVSGVVPCKIEFQTVNTLTTESINESKCDIFFIGGFGGVDCSGFAENQITDTELLEVREWSLQNPKNLVIVTQVNALAWGYTPITNNTNPNLPTGNEESAEIFNGPFGTINSFSQGGCYQGAFSDFPSTGNVPLAIDSSPEGNITILIDAETNDIIVGDVDIFTDLGGVSFGPGINNNNDILLANIFSLACTLTTPEICDNGIDDDHDGFIDENDSECKENVNYIDTDLCDGAIELQDQVFSEPGDYEIVIENSLGCDSLMIYLKVRECLAVYFPNAFTPNGDGINDIFAFYTNSRAKLVKILRIYDRWGGLLYEARNFSLDSNSRFWDGTNGTKRLQSGVYLYSVIFELDNDKEVQYSGEVTLMR